MSASANAALVFQYYHTIIQNLYCKHSLSNIQSVEPLLKQFPGKEYLVYLQICKKCGVEPEEQPTSEQIVNKAKEVDESDEGKVSTWLSDKGFERYAKSPQFRAMKWEIFKTITNGDQLRAQGVQLEHIQSLLTLIAAETAEKKEDISIEQPVEEPQSENLPEPESEFKIGDDCYTKVFKAGEDEVEEGWLKAKVVRINNDNTYDIYVLNAMAHGVPPEAVNVPRNFLKKHVDNVKVTPPAPVKRPHPDSTKFSRGDRVWVCGLRSHQSYNGLGGKIVIFNEKRYQVELDNGELFAIRAENLVPWDVDVPNESIEAGVSRLSSAGFAGAEDEEILRDLITRLMRYDTSRSTDHVKLGQFAAGYLIAQRRFLSKEDE